jgi:predicted MFS family arabinose efflux permease
MWNRWWIVFASALSHMVGQGAINIFAAGVFIGPITQELGIGRGVMSSAVGLSSVMTALTIPFLGRLIDRFSVRPILLISIVAFALATAALSQLQPFLLFPLFAVSGICGAAQTATPYSKVVVGWFDRERGLALGIMLVGVGLGGVLTPQLAGFLVAHFGWRMAYAGMGVAIILIAFVPTAIFIRERHRTSSRGEAMQLPGLTFAEAISCSWQFCFLMIAFFLVSVGVNGIIIHVVPLLTDRGMSASAATAILSVSGIAGMVSRVICGYLMDKIYAPYVGIGFFLLPLMGVALFASGLDGYAPLLGMICVGAGLGAEIDLMSFLIARYFGLRAFGALHGLIFSAFLLGQAGGAGVMGWSVQLLGSYLPGLAAMEVFFLIACVLLALLGPYRFPSMNDDPEAPQAAFKMAA